MKDDRAEFVQSVLSSLRSDYGLSADGARAAVQDFGDVFATDLPASDAAALVARNDRGERSASPR